MPGKRATTPLFDLLQQGRARAVESHLPEPETQASARRTRPSREPKAAGLAETPIRIVGGVLQMPLVYAGAFVAVFLAAVLGAWSLAYHRGEAAARNEQRLLESALGPGAAVVEPGGTGSRTQPPGGNQPTNDAGDGSRPNTSQSSPNVPAVGLSPFLTPTGPTQADPRLDRHNYLRLGSHIRPGEVASAIEFLGSRGLDCFGVIESGGRGGNDDPLFVLYAGLGFPSGEAGSSQARQYREQIVAAGTAWKAAGGVRNFDDAGWELFTK